METGLYEIYCDYKKFGHIKSLIIYPLHSRNQHIGITFWIPPELFIGTQAQLQL
jgi:hypothetical protein